MGRPDRTPLVSSPKPGEAWSLDKGRKNRRAADDADSFFHIRVYQPRLSDDDDFFKSGDAVYMRVASCHVDVNELSGSFPGWDSIPSGFPDPGLGYDRYKFGGNSEYVEDWIANKWAARYGSEYVERDSVPLANAENAFTVNWTKTVTRQLRRGIVSRSVCGGKWWKSDGNATVLWIPASP